MPGDTDSPRKKEILVDPFDLTFVWPLRLRDSGGGKAVGRESVKRALLDNGWKQIEDLVRRTLPSNPDPKMDGYAYAEMVYFHPFVQSFLYGWKDSRPGGRVEATHFDLYCLPRLSGKKLEIEQEGWEEEFVIHEVLFHSFDGEVALLTLRLEATRPVTWDSARNTISLMRTPISSTIRRFRRRWVSLALRRPFGEAVGGLRECRLKGHQPKAGETNPTGILKCRVR